LHQHLYHFSLVTATVLLSLTSTIKLPGNPGNWAVSAQAQTTQEQRNEALRLNNVGLGQFNTGQFREALQTFEQALFIFRAIGDRQSEGITLINIGAVYDKLGQYGDALKSYEQALVIVKQVGDEAIQGITLNKIGVVYDNLGQYPDALKSYEQESRTVCRCRKNLIRCN
jgi:tetratricopeptide (TPR) repeat protein